MAIFGVLELEPVVQIGDKTRLKADKSFVSKDEAAVSLIRIEPEAGAGFVDVTGSSSRDWYLDWAYSGLSRTSTISLEITTDGGPSLFTDTIEILTESDDYLFSTDDDIITMEEDILKWVRDGRSSFLDFHRRARDLIIQDLDDQGYKDQEGNRLTKQSLVDIEEVREWAAVKTLKLIFNSLSNATDDIFAVKALAYEGKEKKRINKAYFRYDYNNDGEIKNETEAFAFQSISVRRE